MSADDGHDFLPEPKLLYRLSSNGLPRSHMMSLVELVEKLSCFAPSQRFKQWQSLRKIDRRYAQKKELVWACLTYALEQQSVSHPLSLASFIQENWNLVDWFVTQCIPRIDSQLDEAKLRKNYERFKQVRAIISRASMSELQQQQWALLQQNYLLWYSCALYTCQQGRVVFERCRESLLWRADGQWQFISWIVTLLFYEVSPAESWEDERRVLYRKTDEWLQATQGQDGIGREGINQFFTAHQYWWFWTKYALVVGSMSGEEWGALASILNECEASIDEVTRLYQAKPVLYEQGKDAFTRYLLKNSPLKVGKSKFSMWARRCKHSCQQYIVFTIERGSTW